MALNVITKSGSSTGKRDHRGKALLSLMIRAILREAALCVELSLITDKNVMLRKAGESHQLREVPCTLA